MIKPNTENSNNLKVPFGGLASNTRLIPPNTTLTTANNSTEATANKPLHQNNSAKETQGVFHNHLDWLTLSFTRLTEEKFNNLLQRTGRGLVALEKNKPWSSGERAKSYQNTITSPIGLKGAYSYYQAEISTDTFYDVTISLSGEYFAPLGAIEQWELCRNLDINYSASCSRIDTSVDDYSFENIPLNEMIEAYRQGDYFDLRDYHHETDEKDPNNPSTVHYFGGKGSKKLVRVYNHKNKSLRLETQFRGEHAQVAFQAVANLKREFKTDEELSKVVQTTIGGIAVGAIDYRDKSKLKNQKKACKSKTKRLLFWQNFIDKVGAVHRIKVTKEKPDLTMYQGKFNWLEKVTSKTFAIIFNLLGEERFINYVLKLVRYGESRFTPSDKKQIEYLRGNLQYLDLD